MRMQAARMCGSRRVSCLTQENCICRSSLCSDTLHLCETAVLVVVKDGNRRALYWQVWQDTREFL